MATYYQPIKFGDSSAVTEKSNPKIWNNGGCSVIILFLVSLATWVVVAHAHYYKPVKFDDAGTIRHGDIVLNSEK